MAVSQKRSRRKVSGGRYKRTKGKKLYELGNKPTLPKIGATKLKSVRGMGGNVKNRLMQAEFVNAIDPKTKKASKVKMLNVVGNPANRHYVRRNILTKGTVVETEKGKVRVTSRPAQDGTVNGVFVA